MPALPMNGRYVPHGAAVVHIEDRGYQFADGVCEVVPIDRGNLVDEEPHLDRLDLFARRIADQGADGSRALKMVVRGHPAQRRPAGPGLYAGDPRRPARPQFPKSSPQRPGDHPGRA